MRVCYVLEASGGGCGQAVIDLIRTNAHEGVDITLIYSPTRAEPMFLKAIKAFEKKIRIIAHPMERSVGLHDMRAGKILYYILRRTGPFDVIHSHSSKAGALARIVGLFLPGKQIYTPHAFVTMAPHAPRVYVYIERMLSWLGSAVICVSDDELRHARDHLKISTKKLFTIPNGVAPDQLVTRDAARATMKAGTNHYVVGFIGRLTEQKQPLRLIDAFTRAYIQNPQLRLVIIGDGPLRDDLKYTITTKGLDDVVQILGQQDSRNFLPGFDCLVSCSDYEGFPLVFLESLAAGVPIISTPVGGAKDTIGKNETGILLSTYKVEDIANAILKLASLPPAAQQTLSAAARARAQEFSLTQLQKRTWQLYNRLRRR